MKNLTENEISQAMEIVCASIIEDEGYRIGWQANIAMAFKDEMNWSGLHSPNEDNPSILVTPEMLHKIANTAADNFLNTLTRK